MVLLKSKGDSTFFRPCRLLKVSSQVLMPMEFQGVVAGTQQLCQTVWVRGSFDEVSKLIQSLMTVAIDNGHK